MRTTLLKLLVSACFACLLNSVTSQAHALDSWEIRKEFFKALESEKDFGRYEIGADVRAGKVVLSGIVCCEESRARAEKIMWSLDGVKSVSNQLEIDPAFKSAGLQPAFDVAEVDRRIKAQSSLGTFSIMASAQGETLVLSGQVTNPGDIARIENIAGQVPGVQRIDNRITTAAAISDRELADRVLQALAANPEVDTRGISIASNAGVVTISGKRPEHRDRDRILSIALMVEGVKDVEGNFER